MTLDPVNDLGKVVPHAAQRLGAHGHNCGAPSARRLPVGSGTYFDTLAGSIGAARSYTADIERSRVTSLGLFLVGCLALAIASTYVAFLTEPGTDIGHWRYLEMAVLDLALVGTPAILIVAAGFAWVHAARAARGLPITRRTHALAGIAALFAIAMAIGRPRSEAVALFAERVVHLAS